VSIFDKRVNILPYEYPALLGYKDAIRHSYWIHTEYNFTTDIDDFKTKISHVERESIKRTMLAIAQIEVNVKGFWGDIYKRLPKTEIQSVGATFAESEVRHFDGYKELLTILNLQGDFETLLEVPEIQNRINYLTKYLDGTRSKDDKMYTKAILLFSLFIEYVSLFSQFLIMLSFNKEKNLFKGISNVVESTCVEELIHGNFGAEIVNIIKSEFPEWFDKEFIDLIYSACNKAYEAESKLLDWIFKDGELEFLPKKVVDEFIKGRFNQALNMIGLKDLFKLDLELLEPTLWFDVEIKSTKEGDFFYKKPSDYNKKAKSITEDDLF